MSISEGSEERMLKPRIYTVDSPIWEDNSCRTLQKNSLLTSSNRSFVVALLGFALIASAVMATFGFFVFADRDDGAGSVFTTAEVTTPPFPIVSHTLSSHATATVRSSRTVRVAHKDKTNRTNHGQTEATRKANIQHAAPFRRRVRSTSRRSATAPVLYGIEEEPSPSLTLPGDVVPKHYSLLLHPHQDDSRFVFSGMVHIEVICMEETRRIVLHASGIQVNTARVTRNTTAKDGTQHEEEEFVKKMVLNSTSQLLSLKLGRSLIPNTTYNVSFTFVGVLGTNEAGFYKTMYTTKNGTKRWIALTHMMTRYARQLFPCFDGPVFRTTFDVQVLRRKDFNAVSNMPILRLEVSKHNDYVNDVFLRTPPIPTYMLGIAVTDFTHIGRGIVKVWAESGSHYKAEFVLQYAISCLQKFEKYFGTRYALPKLDVVISPAEVKMQGNLGIVILPNSVLGAKLSLESRRENEKDISRAILKQWVGGIISFSSWHDFWLEEALAQFLLYDQKRQEGLNVREEEETFELNMQELLAKDMVHSVHPLTFNTEVSPRHAFDRFASHKGELLLRMFDSIMPPHPIQKCLRAMLTQRKYDTVSQDDLWAQLSKENKDNMPNRSLPVSWTHNAGFPLVTLNRTYGKRTAVITQRPYHANISDATWEIPVTYTDGEKMDFENTSNVVWLTTNEVRLPDPPKDDDWVVLNIGSYGYYRANYDARNWNLIIMELNTYHTNIGMLNRARILDDLYDLANEGTVPYGTALHATEYLRKEKELIPWMTAFKRWKFLEIMLSVGDILEKWKLFITRLLIHHIHSFKWSFISEESSKRRLRNLHYEWACKYKYGTCVIEARHAFELYKSAPARSKSMLPEHQVTVFCAVIEDGGMTDWQFLYNRLKYVSKLTERTNIIIALGCSRTRSTIYRYFHEFSAPHFGLVPRIFAEVSKRSPFGKSVTSDYLLDNWPPLKKLYPKTFTDILFAVFGYVNTLTELSKVHSLYRDGGALLESAHWAFERIERNALSNIKWVVDYYDVIARWLKRDVTEFILDDQLLRGNLSTYAAAENGTAAKQRVNE